MHQNNRIAGIDPLTLHPEGLRPVTFSRSTCKVLCKTQKKLNEQAVIVRNFLFV